MTNLRRFLRGIRWGRHDYCYECGHRPTWREAIREAWKFRKPPEPNPFGDLITSSILDDFRPTNVLGPLYAKTKEPMTFIFTTKDES